MENAETEKFNISLMNCTIPKEAQEVSSKFSNTAVVSINPVVARLTFGENFSADKSMEYVKFHTAISMAISDLEGLAKTILNMIEDARSKEKLKVLEKITK